MNNSELKPTLLTGGLLLAASVGLFCLPRPSADGIRAAVHDASLPGHRLLRWSRTEIEAAWTPITANETVANEADRLRTKARAWQRRCRRLAVENGLLRERLREAERIGASPYEAVQTEPLVVPELIEAAVLGEETASAWRAGLLLDEGSAAGVRESALVLEGDGPLIDQGQDAGLETGQPVFAGRIVVGKTAVVGRWTCTVRPVTDAAFRGKARLARRTSGGLVFGARAVLQGTGERLCRLKFVAADEPVRPGDEVYTGIDDPAIPWPMYYGKVVEAELPAGANHWEIRVEPASDGLDLRTVQVLTRRLNPLRRLAH